MREDKAIKLQQQSLDVPNAGTVKPDKPFISDKYNNQVELKKFMMMK